jgi:hypothetical protein
MWMHGLFNTFMVVLKIRWQRSRGWLGTRALTYIKSGVTLARDPKCRRDAFHTIFSSFGRQKRAQKRFNSSFRFHHHKKTVEIVRDAGQSCLFFWMSKMSQESCITMFNTPARVTPLLTLLLMIPGEIWAFQSLSFVSFTAFLWTAVAIPIELSSTPVF